MARGLLNGALHTQAFQHGHPRTAEQLVKHGCTAPQAPHGAQPCHNRGGPQRQLSRWVQAEPSEPLPDMETPRVPVRPRARPTTLHRARQGAGARQRPRARAVAAAARPAPARRSCSAGLPALAGRAARGPRSGMGPDRLNLDPIAIDHGLRTRSAPSSRRPSRSDAPASFCHQGRSRPCRCACWLYGDAYSASPPRSAASAAIAPAACAARGASRAPPPCRHVGHANSPAQPGGSKALDPARWEPCSFPAPPETCRAQAGRAARHRAAAVAGRCQACGHTGRVAARPGGRACGAPSPAPGSSGSRSASGTLSQRPSVPATSTSPGCTGSSNAAASSA